MADVITLQHWYECGGGVYRYVLATLLGVGGDERLNLRQVSLCALVKALVHLYGPHTYINT